VSAAIVVVALSSYRPTAPGAAAAPYHPVLARLTSAEERFYAYRLHQLEQDLARDDQDFDVLIRLGQLHLQLGECQVTGRTGHLRRARYYILRAGLHAMFRPDAFQVRSLLEAANSPNPSFVLDGTPADAAAPPRLDEAWVRMRIGFLEEQAAYAPPNSRLLRRLAENYAALYVLVDRHQDGSLAQWQGGTTVSDAGEAKRLAELYYNRSLGCARTHEARCRTLHGLADLYRSSNEPARAASILQQVVTLQPNNWLACLETASLCRQLGLQAKAESFERQAARWRTPGWI
jgi:hypothetical protein